MKTKIISKQTGKNFGANAIVGILYFAIIGGILGVVGAWIGFENATDLNEVASAIAMFDPMAFAFSLVMLLVVGGLIIPLAYLNVKMHSVFGDKSKFEYKFNKRPAILAVAGAGLVWLFLIVGINAFFAQFYADQNVNILDAGTLLNSLLAFRIDIVAISLIGFAITGWLLGWSVKIIPKATDKISSVNENLTKI